jgi:hypothetical protein
VEKVKDPVEEELDSVAVQETLVVTGTELGLHRTDAAALEVIAKLKDPVPPACDRSPE